MDLINRNRDNEERRKDKDLDSIEVGTPSSGGRIKVYFNSSEDDDEELKRRIDIAKEGVDYANG